MEVRLSSQAWARLDTKVIKTKTFAYKNDTIDTNIKKKSEDIMSDLADYGFMVFDPDFGFRSSKDQKIEWVTPNLGLLETEEDDN